jgi:hypothetical protein
VKFNVKDEAMHESYWQKSEWVSERAELLDPIKKCIQINRSQLRMTMLIEREREKES